ncbi:MAG: DUF2029 domain-containing protein, partial [Candidatus Eremiobacteraeota bacterium]|nr:DUF2029 domain-containing protein [Candidatus Eremiobacteraeota bacterium]
GVAGPVTNPVDFRAFYCGGQTVARGRNPYRVEPLRTCERASLASSGLRMDEKHLLPAPLPPYALIAFAPFSALPMRLASQSWLALNIVALAFAIVGVARLGNVRLPIAVLAMLGSLGFASLIIGQLVPIVVAALIFAALCARRGNGVGAAICVAVASIEPHLALPAWCGLALFVPRSRVPLAFAAASLGVLSLLAGPALNVEYISHVLPQHARSEAYNFAAQYSLSSLLVAGGAPLDMALRLGTLSYGCALALGLWLGRLLQRRYDDSAFAITVPLAAILLGGPFLHGHQIAAALPFALMLLGRVSLRTPLFVAMVIAVCALAIPWESIAEMPIVADSLPQVAPAIGVVHLPPAGPSDSAELSYTAFVDAFAHRADSRTALEQLLTKLPTWIGLIVLLSTAAGLAFRRESKRACATKRTLRLGPAR